MNGDIPAPKQHRIGAILLTNSGNSGNTRINRANIRTGAIATRTGGANNKGATPKTPTQKRKRHQQPNASRPKPVTSDIFH